MLCKWCFTKYCIVGSLWKFHSHSPMHGIPWWMIQKTWKQTSRLPIGTKITIMLINNHEYKSPKSNLAQCYTFLFRYFLVHVMLFGCLGIYDYIKMCSSSHQFWLSTQNCRKRLDSKLQTAMQSHNSIQVKCSLKVHKIVWQQFLWNINFKHSL